MAKGTYLPTASIGGDSTSGSIIKTADRVNNYVGINLPVATTLLTYVNDEDDTGSGTLPPGHGLATGVYDLYWAAGVRYGMDVTIAGGNVITDISDSALAGGDAIPVDDTVVSISEQVDINTVIDGDEVKLISLNSSLRSNIHFIDVAGSTLYATELIGNEPQVWHDTNGLANPYTGVPIGSAVASNGETSGAATLDILCLEDSTP